MHMTTILVVDDDQFMREALIDILQLNGYDTLSADSGDSALDVLAGNSIDAIICDYNMPVNGYEFSKTVRTDKAYDAHKRIPIIGYGDFPDWQRQYVDECYRKGEKGWFDLVSILGKHISSDSRSYS